MSYIVFPKNAQNIINYFNNLCSQCIHLLLPPLQQLGMKVNSKDYFIKVLHVDLQTYLKRLSIILWFIVTPIYATADPSSLANDQSATALLNSCKTLPLEQRIVQLSAALLNKPYQEEPLGEGQAGQFNQEPLYRFDVFDCETYVNTVWALALANDLTDFKTKMQNINYTTGKISFATRAHFPDADLIPNNENNGYLKEITKKVAGAAMNTSIAHLFIDRKDWYQKLTLDRIKIANLNATQKLAKLNTLHAMAFQTKNSESTITYIPNTKLFNPQSKYLLSWWNHKKNLRPNWAIFNKVPNGTVIFFIEHNPRVKNQIGTEVNISHMGFVVWKNNVPYLRAASSLKRQTIDLPLIDYLQSYLDEPTMKGIALFQICSAATPNS